MHDEIDLAVAQGDLQILGEDAFASDIGERSIGVAVSGRGQGDVLDAQSRKGVRQPFADPLRLRAGQSGTTRADSDAAHGGSTRSDHRR